MAEVKVDSNYFAVDDTNILIENGKVLGRIADGTTANLVTTAEHILREDYDRRKMSARKFGQRYFELSTNIHFSTDVDLEKIMSVIERMKGKIGLLDPKKQYVLGPLVVRSLDDPDYHRVLDDYGVYEVEVK